MSVRAAVLRTQGEARPYATSRPLTIERVDLDEPQRGEVLVRVVSAGLCHSDLTTIEGPKQRALPAVMGHEGSGVVEKVGPDVDDLKPGDHVVFVWAPGCGHCRFCLAGRRNLCTTYRATRAAGALPGGGRRISLDGETINHYVGVSCFAERAVVSRVAVHPIPDDVPFEDAALLGCAVLTGVGAAIHSGNVRVGDAVAVVGLGGIGLSCLLGAVVAGAATIIAADIAPEKLELALSLGATHVVDAREPDAVERIQALTDGGVDVGFEMAGNVRAIELAYRATVRGGTTVTAGLASRGDFTISPADFVSDGRRLVGSYLGDSVIGRDLPRYIELYRQGRLPIDRLRSGELALDDINAGFDRLADGTAARLVVTMD
jgi:alcohol dehydrogenase